MDADFWHRRWEENEIAFHGSEANPMLVKYFQELALPRGSRVFVPLCGKTLDICWLLSNGYRVAGAELSETAIEHLFVGLEMEPQVSDIGEMRHYRGESLDIYVGNVFDLTGDMLGPVDAIYDRAALVALPEETRARYTAHLTHITHTAPQLLLCFEYDQRLMDGPPFSIPDEEVHRHYRDVYDLRRIASTEVPGGLKGAEAKENVWLLSSGC